MRAGTMTFDLRHLPMKLARAAVPFLGVVLAACQPVPPAKVGAPAPTAPSASAPPPSAAPAAPARIVLPSLDVPPGPLYVCATGETRTPIELDARVDALCRRHPEMGPCQYERDACRRRGGRVYTGRGEEVTVAVEAEYDKVVRRVRFRGN
jgi:hypothetical protein